MMKRKVAEKSVEASPALTYINLIHRRIGAIRKDVPALIDMGEHMAKLLIDGGNCFPPPVAPYWTNEWSGRAGGLMGVKPPNYTPQSSKDIAYFALPDSRDWDPKHDTTLQSLIKSKSQLFVIGRPDELKDTTPISRFAGFTGGVNCQEGLYRLAQWCPLAPTWPLDRIARGWIVTGEMIAACTRAGRMPVLWMSVWLEGAIVRNGAFLKHDNLRETWYNLLFHDDRYIPPLEPGYAASEFLRELEKIVAVLETQSGALSKAGEWMAQAHRAGHRPWMTAVGHTYPKILHLPEKNNYPLEWSESNSNLQTAVPSRFGREDVAIHFGYSPVDVEDVARILKRGIRFVYTSPYGRPAALKDHPNLLWLDLPWRPADATVDIPGYSVRMLPMSSSAQTVAYFAILCEMAERMGWK